MKYKVYFNGGNNCIIYNKNSKCLWNMFKREHTGDTTNISFTVSGDTISYSITNPSERTQYLLNNDLLGLGLFIHEHDVYISNKWRTDLSKRNHAHRRCIYVVQINSLSGTLNLNTAGGWAYQTIGSLSRSMYRIFQLSYDYEDPYRSTGYENIALGIGRCNPDLPVGEFKSRFRPHRVSDEVEIQVNNKIDW